MNKKELYDSAYGKINKIYELIFDDNGYLTKITDTDSDGRGKARYILNYIKETSCSPKDIILIYSIYLTISKLYI